MNAMAADYSLTRNYIEWLAVLPWSKSSAGEVDILQGEGDPRRGSLRPEEGEGPHPGLPVGAAVEAGHEGADPVLRRTSGRGQNIPRPERGEGAGTEVLAHLAGRHARRGGAARTSPDLHRRAAGADDPEPEAGGDQRSGVHAGRDRQAGARLPRRSGERAAGGAGSGAEQHVPRQLSRPAVRPVEGAVHLHGEPA